MLCIYCQNVRSLNTKSTELFLHGTCYNFNIITFTQTWLKPHTFDNEILKIQFQIFRCDRLNIIKGGFLLAVHFSTRSDKVLVLKVKVQISGSRQR